METKYCSKCDQHLPHSDFYRRGENGLQAKCKTCQNKGRAAYVKPHEVSRRRHKLSDQEYSEIMSRVPEGCEICRKSMGEKICFDHCHDTGEFRGLLCHRCNTMLGLAKDDFQTLDRASLYLQK
jgi:hypothetical protein